MSRAGHEKRTPGYSSPELIVNAAGESMSPVSIEAKLKASSPLIGQAVCLGHQRPYNVALIVLDPRARATYAGVHDLPNGSPATLAADERVQDAIALAIDSVNERLSAFEQIRRFAIMPVDWWPGSDELTPTMKPRRKSIAAKYADEIEWMYAGAGLQPE